MNADDLLAQTLAIMKSSAPPDPRTLVIHSEDYIALKQIGAIPVEQIGSFYYGIPVIVSEYVDRDTGLLIDLQKMRNKLDSMLLETPRDYWWVEWESKAQRRRRVKREIREEIAARRLAKALNR